MEPIRQVRSKQEHFTLQMATAGSLGLSGIMALIWLVYAFTDSSLFSLPLVERLSPLVLLLPFLFLLQLTAFFKGIRLWKTLAGQRALFIVITSWSSLAFLSLCLPTAAFGPLIVAEQWKDPDAGREELIFDNCWNTTGF